MPALEKLVQEKLSFAEKNQQKRILDTITRVEGGYVLKAGRKLLSFSCNDYLGLSQHPEVIEAGAAALLRYGAGAGASRLVSGNNPLYSEAEHLIAQLKGTEAALVFGSGYMANIGIIPALMGREDLIIADKLVHACIIDGITLSGAKHVRFSHNDVEHAASLLVKHRKDYRHCLIITETVFSMDGDVAPLAELRPLADSNDAWLMTDDAHGLGIIKNDVKAHIQMGTLSKAVGVYGGYVACSREVQEYLISHVRSLLFTTGLPPSVLASAVAALEIIRDDAVLCATPLERAKLFTSLLGLPEAQSAIVPLILGDSPKALASSAFLESQGYYVKAIRPPTVPENTSRLRFAFSVLHREEDIRQLVDIIRGQGWLHG